MRIGVSKDLRMREGGAIDSSSPTPTLKIVFLNVNYYSYNDI
jgi:hypothetical protein